VGCANLLLLLLPCAQGTKFQTWEGGVRMPAIAWWPGHIAPASASTQLASTLDLFATILDLAGLSHEMPTGRVMDTYSLRPILLPGSTRTLLGSSGSSEEMTDGGGGGASSSGSAGALRRRRPVNGVSSGGPQQQQQQREVMFLYNGCTLAAVRKGEWKAHYRTTPPSGNGGIGGGVFYPPPGDHDPPVLYHIPTDPAERFPIIWNATIRSRQDLGSHGLPPS
jgi:arylsulfatase A-like enzyme